MALGLGPEGCRGMAAGKGEPARGWGEQWGDRLGGRLVTRPGHAPGAPGTGEEQASTPAAP